MGLELFLDLEASIPRVADGWSGWFVLGLSQEAGLTPSPLARGWRGKAVPEDGLLLCQLNEALRSTQWKTAFTVHHALHGDTLGCFRAPKGLCRSQLSQVMDTAALRPPN